MKPGTRILSWHNFVIPWHPWRGLTLGELYQANPDAAFRLREMARERQCPPLLRGAINTFVRLRRSELARRVRRTVAREQRQYVSV